MYIDKIDTMVVKGKPIIIKKRVPLPQQTITITKLVKDSAEIKALAVENKNCNDDVQRKWQWIKWLFLALVISLILNVILISRK